MQSWSIRNDNQSEYWSSRTDSELPMPCRPPPGGGGRQAKRSAHLALGEQPGSLKLPMRVSQPAVLEAWLEAV